MKRHLTELWYGNIAPIKEPSFDRDREMRLYADIEAVTEMLGEQLDADGRKLLDALNVSHKELQDIMREECFIHGFSLGVRMTAEAYSES